jgi:hypothetical protein
MRLSMPMEAYIVVLLFHLIAMLFMAAPLYALITVNERARAPQQFHESIRIRRETWQANLS